jgi:hypothetical protein
MQTVKIGILADTHLHQPTPVFAQQVALCFAEVSIIFHAGDLTNIAILQAFKAKEVHAVHGNMCDFATMKSLPRKKTVRIGDFTIGIIHRSGNSYDFENSLLDEFDGVDCIVFGHTHQPVCQTVGGVLYINPEASPQPADTGLPAPMPFSK